MAFPANSGFSGFNTDERFQGNYGGGVKYQANKWFGIPRGRPRLHRHCPAFRPAKRPTLHAGVYIPNGKILNGIQATAGLTLYVGTSR